MKKPVCLYYSMLKYQPENLARLEKEFEMIVLNTPDEDRQEILKGIEVLFAPLGYMVDRAKIDACPNLKVIVSNTTGHPHIEVDYAKAKGVQVACLKYAQNFLKTITPTAELTWGLIITLTRNIITAHNSSLEGHWDRRPFGAAAMLSSMALGIIGHGRLGTMVARYGKAFGMAVRYYDPFVPNSTEGAQRVGKLADLVSISDVVTLHVPHEKENERMINSHIFDCFKPGSYLINTARGELIDWDSLLSALKSGRLAGAALDVFEGEFLPGFENTLPGHPVLEYARTHDNLILTPHIGGSTVDAWRLTESYAIDMALAAIGNIR